LTQHSGRLRIWATRQMTGLVQSFHGTVWFTLLLLWIPAELLGIQTRDPAAEALLKESQAALAKGDYGAAAARAEGAARIFVHVGDLSGQADALNQIGMSWIYRGNYERALQSYKTAIELNRRSGDANQLVMALNNVGSIYFFLGRYSEALDNYQNALKEVEQHVGQSWSERRFALTSANLAVLFEQVGQNQKALEYYKRTQQRAKKLSAVEYGQLLSNLGTLYRRLGDPKLAMDSYRKAGEVLERGQHGDAEIHILENIGIVMALDLNDDRGAVAAFTQALALARKSVNKRQELLAHLFRGEAYFRTARAREAAEDFRAALEQADTAGAAEEKWSALFHLGKLDQRAGDSEAALRRYEEAISIIESLRSDLRESSLRSEFLANKRDVYDAAIDLLLSRPRMDHARVFELIEQARERRLQDTLRSKERLTMQTAQSRLQDRDVLLEYWLGADKVALIQLTRSKAEIGVRLLGKSDQVRIQRYGAALQEHSSQHWREESRAIGALLLMGLQVEKSSRIFVAPDGLLTEIPFETLSRGNRLLVEQAEVSYLPAASALKNYPRTTPVTSSARKLVFGDPVPAPEIDADFGESDWARLPYSSEEVTNVAKLLGPEAIVYAGTADRKRTFLQVIGQVPFVIHLSTHAAVDLRNPDRSRILFSPEKGDLGSQYLFLREVSALKLGGTDLVTVSACETERGALTPGEGLQSFSRAFLTAGAASTVTTLWRVEDQQTAEFMKRFYLHLSRGSTKSSALKGAKLDFLRSGTAAAEPRYWAAFVLNGEGRSAIFLTHSFSWHWVALTVAGVAAAGGAAIVFGRRRRLGSDSRGRNG
jgi:CHAT domain-containing protein